MQATKIDFQINALSSEQFAEYFSFSKEQLSEIGARIIEVDSNPGTPCRVSLSDAEIGEKVLAICYVHHNVNSPYKESGPIFVRQGVQTAKLKVNEIPKMLLHRTLSIRAYDNQNLMVQCEVITGDSLAEQINRMFGSEQVEYIHVHNAKPGCYNCSVHRC